MEFLTENTFDANVFIFLTGLIAAAMFFAMIGIRELKIRRFEGILYIALSLFFLGAHILFIVSTESHHSMLKYITQISLGGWVTILFAPALIFLYIMFGLFNFVMQRFAEGFFKVFIGAVMVVLLYSLGHDWSVIFKIPLIMISSIVWFGFELHGAGELE